MYWIFYVYEPQTLNIDSQSNTLGKVPVSILSTDWSKYKLQSLHPKYVTL